VDPRDDNTTVPSGYDESPKKRQKTLSSSETNTVSPDKNTSVSEYPILSNILGGIIDCNNKDTLGKVNDVALEIIQLLGNGTELTVKHQSNNKEVHYIKVPQNTSDALFKRRGKEWIERVLEVNGGEDDDRDDASRRLAEYLIRNHKSAVLAALHNTDTISICKPMSAIKFASMCQKAKIVIMCFPGGWRDRSVMKDSEWSSCACLGDYPYQALSSTVFSKSYNEVVISKQ